MTPSLHCVPRFYMFTLALIAMALCTAGCETPSYTSGDDATYKTVADSPNRNHALALEKTREAIAEFDKGKFEEAERLLRSALDADVTHGPAHNNLGLVYFKQNKLYLAAWEFQYAINLMSESAPPRNNLGLVLERVGKLDQAIEAYQKAHGFDPKNPEFLGNLARAKVRRDDNDDETRRLLQEVVVRDTRPEWNAWAHEKLVLMNSSPRSSNQTPSERTPLMPTSITSPTAQPDTTQP